MIKVYISPGCLGCRQVVKFFEKHNIKYIKKDFTKTKLTKKEVFDILSLTSNGFNDILSSRSIEYKKRKNKLSDLKINEMIDLIIKYPQIMSRPICIQYLNNEPFRALIGYDADDIEIFLRKDKEKIVKKPKDCGFTNKCGNICGIVNK